MFKRELLVGCGVLFAWPALAQTESAEDYLRPKPDHDQLGYVPQQQMPEDYTQGSVRLGVIPDQDLVRRFGPGNFGARLGELKPVKPSNVTASATDPNLPQAVTTRQTVGLDRDLTTGLPTDANQSRFSGLNRFAQTNPR